jgi:large subunit ribosomal protein L9
MSSQVQVILREEVHKLGAAGDVVNVKAGYARNFLVPRGKASLATASQIAEVEHHKRVIGERQAKELKDLNAFAQKIHSIVLETTAQAGEEDKLFGSVTSQNIADLLAEKGIEIDRRKIELSEPIKSLGEHKIDIKLHREVVASVKLVVSAAE